MTAVTERDGPEQELRILLERAVPQPPAPPQRLERVRERVGRRRRRRTAAVTGSAVLAAAAGLMAVPGLVRPQAGGAAPVVATGGQADKRPTPSAGVTGQPTPAPGTAGPQASDGVYRPTGMDGLRLSLPSGWQTLPDPATRSVFVSSQALALPENGCAHALDDFCTPLARRLGRGGTLVMFRLDGSQDQADKLQHFGGEAGEVGEELPYTACRTVGGTRQLGTSVVGEAGSSTVVRVTACLAQPSSAQLALAEDLLSTADVG